jgi:hypothetical protein
MTTLTRTGKLKAALSVLLKDVALPGAGYYASISPARTTASR